MLTTYFAEYSGYSILVSATYLQACLIAGRFLIMAAFRASSVVGSVFPLTVARKSCSVILRSALRLRAYPKNHIALNIRTRQAK